MSAGYMRKCAGKKRFETQQEAESHRRSMIARGLWQTKTSNTYGCPQCGGYHGGRMGVRNRGQARKTAKGKARFMPTQ